MANTLTGAIYEKVLTALTGLVSTYRGSPALFSIDPIPTDALRPYAVIRNPSEDRFDTKSTRGVEHTRDVEVFTDVTGSSIAIEAMQDAVIAALNRQPLVWTGHRWVISEVVRAADALTDGTVVGRTVTVRVIFEEA